MCLWLCVQVKRKEGMKKQLSSFNAFSSFTVRQTTIVVQFWSMLLSFVFLSYAMTYEGRMVFKKSDRNL